MQLELRGVPTVTIVADSFEGLFRSAARSLGLPNLPRVVTPYPVAPDGEFPGRIRARVDAFSDALATALSAPPGAPPPC